MRRRRRTPKPAPKPAAKPQLRMQITYECRVHHQDLEAFLAQVYGTVGYDVLRATGVSRGMIPEFIVTGTLPPATNIEQQADAIRRGRRTQNLHLVLNVLCQDGFIPAGKYVIDTTKRESPIVVYTRLLNTTHDPNHPRCLAFKRKHQGNTQFMKRAAILDRRANQEQRDV